MKGYPKMKKVYNVNIISIVLLCLTLSVTAQEKPAAKVTDAAVKKQYETCRELAAGQWKTGVSQEEKNKTAEQLGKILNGMAESQKIKANERLTLLFQAAGTYGLRNDFKMMNLKMEEALRKADGLDAASTIEAYQNAALLYMYIRAYDVVRILKERGDALLDTSRVRNSFVCRFMPSVPLGASGWAQSDFVRDAKNMESRFRAYPHRGDMLKDDVAAERPADEKGNTALSGRETSFSMVYDTKGWYIYVRSDEPDIDQVMMEDGRRGSSLEMFFAPGRKEVPYYQWIVSLAKNESSLFHWGTPHRFYRYLEKKAGGMQVETVAMSGGWGTLIFIPWECLYDKLPFIEGNDDTWRFSIMRWGPVSITWGGRVHETGRWGMIHWQPPTPEQRLGIEKNLIRRSWWRYQAAKSSLSDYWQSSRGDAGFYRDALEPLIREYDQYGEKIKDVDKWDAKTVNDVFMKMVPEWMEFNYKVEELRTEYLKHKFFMTEG